LGLTAQVLRGRRCIEGGPGNSLGLTGHVLRVPRHSLGPAVCRRDAPLELRAAPPTFRQGGRRCKRRPRNALACGCIGFGGSHLGFTMLSIFECPCTPWVPPFLDGLWMPTRSKCLTMPGSFPGLLHAQPHLQTPCCESRCMSDCCAQSRN